MPPYLVCPQGYVRRNPGNQPGHFPCPMCRKSTPVPAGGVECFPDNFLLLSLADTIHETTSSASCPMTTAPGDSWCRASGLNRLSSSHQHHHHHSSSSCSLPVSSTKSNFLAGSGTIAPSHYGPGGFVPVHTTSNSGHCHLGGVSLSSCPSHYEPGGFVSTTSSSSSSSGSIGFTELTQQQQQVQLPPPRSQTLSSSSSTSSTLSSLSALSTSSLVSSAPPSPSPLPPRSLYPPSPREKRHRSHE